jgi:nicotinate-nucleotide adenylyltransferase
MRYGLMGGTFDPIHYGHLVAAEEVYACLGLDKVLFIPAGQPPHKTGEERSPVETRVRLVEMGIASNPHFELSRVDVDRPGPSFSVDMLRVLRKQLGGDHELFFIIGADSLEDFLEWHDPEGIVRQCKLVVVTRPGYGVSVEHLKSRIPDIESRVEIVPIPLMSISASDLRERVANGLPIKYQVPEAVEGYIYAMGLYRGKGQGSGVKEKNWTAPQRPDHRARK